MSQEDVRVFIEDALKGRWKGRSYLSFEVSDLGFIQMYESQEPEQIGSHGIFPVAVALLDPAAWNAVGERRGWPGGFYKEVMRAFVCLITDGWSLNAALRKLGPLRGPEAPEMNTKWMSYDS